jgi:hypothetical protein
VFFEFLQITVDAISLSIVLVDQTPPIAGEPAIDPIWISLALFQGDVTPHPLKMGVGPGDVVFEDATIWLFNLLSMMDVTVVMTHESGKCVPFTGIRLLEVYCFFVSICGHVQPQIRPPTHGAR